MVNVLLATPLFSSHFDSGLWWLRAFQKLGCSVTVWDYRLDPSSLPPVSYYPDFTMVLKGEIIDPRGLPRPRVCYWPDKLERTPEIMEVLQHYDEIFTPVRPTPEGMTWMPTGWDPGLHADLGYERVVDSIYVGTNNSEYKRYMVNTIKPTMVFGNGWKDKEGPVYSYELVMALNRARVLIDLHQSPETGVNRKLFEMIPCGFTIVDRVPGIEDIFGTNLVNKVSFRSPEEARYKVSYYASNAPLRELLRKEELELIQQFTYENSAKLILDRVNLG